MTPPSTASSPTPPLLRCATSDRLDACCEQVASRQALPSANARILALLARGNNAQHIQEQLSISHNTVKYHARNVYRKLDVHSQQELIDLLAEKA